MSNNFLLVGFVSVCFGNWMVISDLCTYFFHQVDALTTKRGQEGGWVVERLLNQVRKYRLVQVLLIPYIYLKWMSYSVAATDRAGWLRTEKGCLCDWCY